MNYESIARNQLEKIKSLNAEVEKLESEAREFKLLVREYFQERLRARFASTQREIVDCEGRMYVIERKIRPELERFTRQEREELPFKELPK